MLKNNKHQGCTPKTKSKKVKSTRTTDSRENPIMKKRNANLNPSNNLLEKYQKHQKHHHKLLQQKNILKEKLKKENNCNQQLIIFKMKKTRIET